MTKISVLMIGMVGLLLVQSGCGSKEMVTTGFLSDYSRLEKVDDDTLIYMDETALAQYSRFIVDPVQIVYYEGDPEKPTLTDEEKKDLTNYFHSKIKEAVVESGNELAYYPGPGVARLRIAITDINKTSAVNILPQASLLQFGVGNASAEAELVDSATGQQIGASVQTRKGSRIPFTNLGDWTTAKQIMDNWAKGLQKRLEEVR